MHFNFSSLRNCKPGLAKKASLKDSIAYKGRKEASLSCTLFIEPKKESTLYEYFLIVCFLCRSNYISSHLFKANEIETCNSFNCRSF